MTTPNPLTQQRQFVRDFLAASKQRSDRERAAQQQYATGEKAAQEQYAGSERAAQQTHTTVIRDQDYNLGQRKSQMSQAIGTITEAWRAGREQLRMLGVPVGELPPALDQVKPRAGTPGASDLLSFVASAAYIQKLQRDALQMVEAWRQQQKQRRILTIAAAIVAVVIAVAGYFFYQQWSYDQRLSGLYQAGVAALDSQDWRVARDRLNELLALEPGYQNAQSLLYNSYILPGQAAFESGDWQTGLAQLGELLRMQPGNVGARALINQYAQAIGTVTNPLDGATYVPVPAGEFLMGSPDDGGDDEHPQHTVYLDAFWIMQTEVTNAQYAKCVAAGACSAPDNSRWQDAAYADHPVTNVDWNQANAYAQWAGGRLPTEAEWEKAARGVDGRTYPWGNEQPNESLTNCCNFVGDTTPVGSYQTGVSPYGVLDMAGNVWEWTADWYDGGYYSQSPAQNPAGPISGAVRSMRGGGYWNDAGVVRVAFRYWYAPGYRHWSYGFRVASSSPGF